MPEQKEGWQVDRRIPLILVFMLLVQTGGFVWWAATAESRISQNERDIRGMADRGDRITRVETHIENISETMSRLETKFDRWAERQYVPD